MEISKNVIYQSFLRVQCLNQFIKIRSYDGKKLKSSRNLREFAFFFTFNHNRVKRSLKAVMKAGKFKNQKPNFDQETEDGRHLRFSRCVGLLLATRLF